MATVGDSITYAAHRLGVRGALIFEFIKGLLIETQLG